MSIKKKLIVSSFLLLTFFAVKAQPKGSINAIVSGIPWFDEQGNVVSAHGGSIIKDNGRYYLFGEKHTDSTNAFAGFNCYSSADLYHWKFEKIALPVQDTGRLGPDRVGERVKVMKCPQSGEYVMLMHTDNPAYKDPCIGYATSKTITGPYVFRGPLLFKGAVIRKWDMGTFQDNDGSGYLLIHGGDLYKLSADYKSIAEHTINNQWPGSESPAVFKHNGTYFWLTSHLSSWERNDNYYYTAPSMKGPWISRGIFAPQGTLTWNSQTTFVLPVYGSADTTYMFMGDRWSFPLQASAATYVWQPLTVSGQSIAIPAYYPGWQINLSTGKVKPLAMGRKIIGHTNQKAIVYTGQWRHATATDSVSASSSEEKGAAFSVKFTGKQIGFYSWCGPKGGYASVTIESSNQKVLLSATVDTYSKYNTSALKFLSPVLAKGTYTLKVSVMGQHSKWSDKKKADYGSTGNVVALEKLLIQ